MVYVLAEIEGLPHQEIGTILSINVGAVKTRLHRARRMLRDELHRRAGEQIAHAFSFHLSRCDRVVSGVLSRIRPPAEARIH